MIELNLIHNQSLEKLLYENIHYLLDFFKQNTNSVLLKVICATNVNFLLKLDNQQYKMFITYSELDNFLTYLKRKIKCQDI